MDYQEKITLLDPEDFVSLFSRFGAEPRWVTSAGKRAIQILGLCHKGENHSALFDPDTLKVHCFSECNGAMLLHTWVKRAVGIDSPHEAKEMIMDWIADQNIDFSDRVVRSADFGYTERKFDIEAEVPMVAGMKPEDIAFVYSSFNHGNPPRRLRDLVWCTKEGIHEDILAEFEVSFCTERDAIMLPHHNELGEIVGIYERGFRMMRREARKQHPEMPYQMLLQYPRAKYVPLLRPEHLRDEEKTSWSFPNSCNLYGLHKAIKHIARTGEAIIFEGGKSVMLSHQYGLGQCVATHTFGAHLNHIAMLYKHGARKIILAFDKQYEEEGSDAWELYEHKTRTLAAKISDKVEVVRMRDKDGRLDFKDAPIDKGKEVYLDLYANLESLLQSEPEPVAPLPEDTAEWRKKRRQQTDDAEKPNLGVWLI